MPIPRELFNEGIDEVDQALLEFLEDSPDQAYSSVELGSALGIELEDLAVRARFFERLHDLEWQGLIAGKIIHGVPFYSFSPNAR